MCASSGKAKRCGKRTNPESSRSTWAWIWAVYWVEKSGPLVAAALHQHEIIYLQAFSINGAVKDMEKAEGVALGFGIIAQGTGIQ